MTKLTAPNGATVNVANSRVESLVRYGFTKPAEAKKASAKKASSSKSRK